MKLKIVVGVLLIGFIGGYMYENKTDEKEMFRTILIAQQDKEQQDQINFVRELNDKTAEGFQTIDNITQLLMKPTIENVDVDRNKPDLYIQIDSTINDMRMMNVDAKVWFTSDGGIIGDRNGETWDDVHYKKLNKIDVEYIKEVMNGVSQ